VADCLDTGPNDACWSTQPFASSSIWLIPCDWTEDCFSPYNGNKYERVKHLSAVFHVGRTANVRVSLIILTLVSTLVRCTFRGITYVNVSIANPANPARSRRKKLLADSSALYSIIPKEVLRAIGIKPYGSETFTLADGSDIQRDVGTAFLSINGRKAPSPVIFGEKSDGALWVLSRSNPWGLASILERASLNPLPYFSCDRVFGLKTSPLPVSSNSQLSRCKRRHENSSRSY
jgi:predicted aspartyl protease